MTEDFREHYRQFARLFSFPSADFETDIKAVDAYFKEKSPSTSASLAPFVSYALSHIHDMHELYIRTFDVQSITTLDIGYVLFGDDYKRGELLSNLNREVKENQIDTGTELSDNLATALRLLSVWKDEALRVEFAGVILFPALIKMRQEFEVGRLGEKAAYYKKTFKTVLDASQDGQCIYKHCLDALLAVLKGEFPQIEVVHNQNQESDFLISLKTETTVEKSQ